MARKNVLREIKGFGKAGVSKGKQQVKSGSQIKPQLQSVPKPLPTIERWEAWQCRGDSSNEANWHQTWEDSSFEECFAIVENNVSCQIDEILNRDNSLNAVMEKYEDDDEKLTRILDSLYNPKIEQIKRECLQNGGYKGDTWALSKTSQSTRFRPLKAKGIFTHSDLWAGYEQVGENANDPKSWRLIVDGSLSKCIEGMGFFITVEIEYATEGQLTDDIEIGDFFRYQTQLRSNLMEEINRVCLIKGEYKGGGWAIHSVRTEEDCWSIVRRGGAGSS